MPIPYKIAVLVYVFNDAGQLLLLHRRKMPNRNLYSPIGGKLEQHLGESPYACALREISEEIEIQLTLQDIRLLGIVSERAYVTAPPDPDSTTHWLMFCFEVIRPLNFPAREFDEGRLEWIDTKKMHTLPIPRTDREVIWPLVQSHSIMLNPKITHPEVFSVHIDCTDATHFTTTYEHPLIPPTLNPEP
jgi:8-oxo-dGTP diphosphatase